MEARLYDIKEDGRVQCNLCSHRCRIKQDAYGLCGVRQNIDGRLETLVYGKLIAINPDPIEKKPLYHFLPGSRSYSIATVGCNLRCDFCQNADISQVPGENGRIPGRDFTPAGVVADAQRRNCLSIAYTYTEPTIFFEFAYDTAVLAHEQGIKNVFVSNGYMSAEAIDTIAPYLDAANIDLKAFTDDFYKTLCGARLQPVLDNLKHLKAAGVFLEVTTLLIPGKNDDTAELEALAGFIADELSLETPWHISRFYPTYKLMTAPPTPVAKLREARDIGRAAGLQYVYIGNVPGDDDGNTYCPECRQPVIERAGFLVKNFNIKEGRCGHCNSAVNIFI